MAAREVDAILSSIGRIISFASAIEDRYYEGSAVVAAFKTKCLVLKSKDDEWRNKLRKFGTDVKSTALLLKLASEADEIREKQDQKLRKMKKSKFQKWKKIAFPTKLTDLLARMEEIVDAGPQLLQASVDQHELLEKKILQTPAPLIFDIDRKYVPIPETVRDVHDALEHYPVVTVYGIAGLGKTSLVRHLALKYNDEKVTPPKTPRFPDGVQFMVCGQGIKGRVKDLLQSLLQRLGFPTDVTAPASDSTQGPSFEIVIDSLRQKLKSCLAYQTLLIIFDDVWETEALQKLLVFAPGVRYLLTSQYKGIWRDAKQIELKRPTDVEAEQIMANHTAGLPKEGEFPDSIRHVTDEIRRQLHNHPLSLANIGISIDGSKAADVSHWKVRKDDVLGVLGASDIIGKPLLHNSTYDLSVNVSMMLMVNSLDEGPRSLLFLMALFKTLLVPERVLKFFFKFILRKPEPEVTLRYDMYVKYLKDRLVIESQSLGNESMLLVHGLRMHYIRDENRKELNNIASGIFVETIHEDKADLLRKGDSEETLVAFYFGRAFADIIGTSLEKRLRIINDAVAGRRQRYIERNGSTLYFSARLCMIYVGRHFRSSLDDYGNEDWQRKAHGYAKKTIIELFCQRKLNDDSMARDWKSFAVEYPQLWKILLDHMHENQDAICN